MKKLIIIVHTIVGVYLVIGVFQPFFSYFNYFGVHDITSVDRIVKLRALIEAVFLAVVGIVSLVGVAGFRRGERWSTIALILSTIFLYGLVFRTYFQLTLYTIGYITLLYVLVTSSVLIYFLEAEIIYIKKHWSRLK